MTPREGVIGRQLPLSGICARGEVAECLPASLQKTPRNLIARSLTILSCPDPKFRGRVTAGWVVALRFRVAGGAPRWMTYS